MNFLTALNKKDDNDKIVKIFENYGDLMIYTAKEIVKDHALAEDVASDSLEKIIRNLDKIESISSHKLKAFIVIIVRNTALDVLRKNGRIDNNYDIENEPIVDTAPLILDKLVSMEGYQAIVKAMNALPSCYRDVAVLHYAYECSHAQISEILGIRNDAVRQRLSRARKILKNKVSR